MALSSPEPDIPGQARRLRLAVLLSGSGSTLQNLLDRIELGQLNAEVVCVIGSRTGAFGLERARRAGIAAVAVPRRQFPSPQAHSAAVLAALAPYAPDLIVLAGYMSLFLAGPEWDGRVMNVHPALIPAFCGHGFYGHHVHEAVLAAGVKLTGATVHFVDALYDHGPIILQDTVPVLPGDTPDSLAERVQALERALYPAAIQLFAEGRLQLQGRHVRIAG